VRIVTKWQQPSYTKNAYLPGCGVQVHAMRKFRIYPHALHQQAISVVAC
jgi:hypothetical protein